MKKVTIAIFSALLSVGSIVAQNPVTNNPDNKFFVGVRVGGDVTMPGKMNADFISVDAFNSGGGIEAGAVFNVPIVANFYIEPGLKCFYDTYSVKKSYLQSTMGDMVKSSSVRKMGLRIPLMLGYHFDFAKDVRLYAFTGPELEFGLSGKNVTKIDSRYANGYYAGYATGANSNGYYAGYATGANTNEIKEDLYGDDGDMRRVNFLWNIGVGVSYKKVYFGINGGIGMSNLVDDPDMKFHESRLTFSVGYNF